MREDCADLCRAISMNPNMYNLTIIDYNTKNRLS